METVVHRVDVSDIATASQVLDLQRSAYRVEADLIGFEDIPPLHESLQDLVAAPLIWLGIESDGRLVAAVAFTREDDHIDVDRLMVAPSLSRRGYGQALLSALDAGATITVSTGTKNLPARRFYESAGFVDTGESSPIAGLRITHLRREGKR